MKLKRFFLLTFAFAFSISPLKAEYRAYQYLISEEISPNKYLSSLIITGHNPKSFKSYYGNFKRRSIHLIRTWRCPGNTSHYKEICKSVEDDFFSNKDNAQGVLP